MSKKRQDVEAIVGYLQQGPDRSPLFWWLAEHHDALMEAKDGKPIRWGPLAVRLASFGLTDREGKPATPETVRLTWKRVRKFVADQAAAKLARDQTRKLQPSHLPATWKPTPVEPPPARAMPHPAPTTNTNSAPAAPIELSEAARARLAALDRRLEWRDRHVNPPKRKD